MVGKVPHLQSNHLHRAMIWGFHALNKAVSAVLLKNIMKGKVLMIWPTEGQLQGIF